MARCQVKGCKTDAGFNPKNGLPNKICRYHFVKQLKGEKLELVNVSKNSPNKVKLETKSATLIGAKNLINDLNIKQQVKKTKPPLIKKIDTREYYSVLKDLIDKRYNFEEQHRSNWRKIKQGYSLGREQKQLDIRIGDINHQINLLISEMIKHGFNQKSAMKLAYDFSQKEQARIEGLISTWEQKRYNVNFGGSIWIDENNIQTDGKNVEVYMNKLDKKLERIKKNISFISKYI